MNEAATEGKRWRLGRLGWQPTGGVDAEAKPARPAAAWVDISDGLILAGAASFEYGLWLVWAPGAWMALGLFLMRWGHVAGRAEEEAAASGRQS